MQSTVNLDAIGIDVGYFSTKFTLGGEPNPHGQPVVVDQFPSLTPTPTTTLQNLPGAIPHDGCTVHVGGLRYFIGKSSGQLVGSEFGFRPANQNFSTTSGYQALLHGALYYIARHHRADKGLVISQLVLGLPLTTVFTHAKALVELATRTHAIPNPFDDSGLIDVRICKTTVLAQPQGALLSMGARLGKSILDKEVLILDMGGGTFDWFLCAGMRPRTAACGASTTGAIACAGAVCDRIDPSYKSDPNIMKRVDLAMREGLEYLELDGVKHCMADLWPAADAVLYSALEQLELKVGSTATVHHIWPTGGGAKLLARVLPTKFPKLVGRIELDSDPVYSNVKGFHLLAQRLHDAEARTLA